MELPEGFRWINKPVTVIGEDFTYEATCLCSLPKSNGKIRYIVEDRGRLFIQREEQIMWLDLDVRDIHQERADREGISRAEAKIRNYGGAYGIDPKGTSKLFGPKPEDLVTLAVLDDMDTELARMDKVTLKSVISDESVPVKEKRGCPHCGYFHPPDGMCI